MTFLEVSVSCLNPAHASQTSLWLFELLSLGYTTMSSIMSLDYAGSLGYSRLLGYATPFFPNFEGQHRAEHLPAGCHFDPRIPLYTKAPPSPQVWRSLFYPINIELRDYFFWQYFIRSRFQLSAFWAHQNQSIPDWVIPIDKRYGIKLPEYLQLESFYEI